MEDDELKRMEIVYQCLNLTRIGSPVSGKIKVPTLTSHFLELPVRANSIISFCQRI